jgi:hypothetical protein
MAAVDWAAFAGLSLCARVRKFTVMAAALASRAAGFGPCIVFASLFFVILAYIAALSAAAFNLPRHLSHAHLHAREGIGPSTAIGIA